MKDKLELIRKAAHDSMWYSHDERKEAYSAILGLIEDANKTKEKPKTTRKTKGKK